MPAAGATQAPQQFRATVTGVGVPVVVREHGRFLRGLSAADFRLTDSGVPQEIAVVDAATVPLDLTVVAQSTIRTGGYGYATFDKEIDAIAQSLDSEDQLRVRYIGPDQRPLTPPLPNDLREVAARQRNCIPVYDAAARAVMAAGDPNRQRVVILMAVGEGAGGFLSTAAMSAIAQRSNARLYVVSVEPNFATTHRSYVSWAMCSEVSVDWSPERQNRLREISRLPSSFEGWRQLWIDGKNRLVAIAELTGGREIRPTVLTQNTTGPIREVLDEARASYILRYTPKGVPDTGWHPITVKVNRPGNYDIRVRPGYER